MKGLDRGVEELFEELISFQQVKLLKLATKVIPHITADDLLQPNDFPQLESHPLFRYEEGLLAGLLEAKMAYVRFRRDREEDF